ncbi:alanine--tRNA ligase [Buchnera aphidicola]|uniref:alanine--tRNA ligase n=1 Tax=Buchnera aphidicola TaxID=9 RepID=UPI002238B7E8|nr:alanine--tRNA ligase [Buchnera aphidicola]MCW5197561.1 alanine--tRNA ligase [Buchnera aphidicola (Chaitophorus viminalis)]
MYKTTEQIRQTFLNFFKSQNHIIYPSSSLIIDNDPTLLFTNAGMNQFKNIFLGLKTIKDKNIASIQHCLRTGGKHNDLENVGYTPRHHTFFEMLGNFSFGSYLKKKSIIYAWKLLTSKKWFNIDPNKLLVTIYEDDIESYQIWKNIIKLSNNQIIFIKNKNNIKYTSENFWKMEKYGPCGPCTEIFYDYGKNIPGSIPGSKKDIGNRFLEIWNIVFIQYHKLPKKKFIKLKSPSVDTGMGLERIASVLQNVQSNYDIDIFYKIIQGIKKKFNLSNTKNNKSLQVISDHIRSSSYIIANNVFPSNEHRGYVLRKIIRRAIRHGRSIGLKKCFFYKIVPILIKSMKNANHLLIRYKNKIQKILKIEELQFSETLNKGLKILKEEIKNLKNNVLDSNIVFYLYDTLGFPIDLTKDFCKEKNIQIDLNKLNKKIKNQKIINVKKKYKNTNKISMFVNNKTNFIGYNFYKTKTIIKKIYINDKSVNKIDKQSTGQIILESTPFYGQSGGQIGDSGIIKSENGIFEVYNTTKNGNIIIHHGKIYSGTINKNTLVKAIIDIKKRKLIEKNHTATHLLHAGLKKVLGKNILQKGSLVNEKKIRFDYTYFKNLNFKKIKKIEKTVNKYIQKNIKVKNFITTFKNAKQKKYIFLENKIYQNNVRIISINSISNELCSGTHVYKTGEIILFKIINENSISFGTRRIEAVTYKKAFKEIYKKEKKLNIIKKLIQPKNSNLIKKIQNILKIQQKLIKNNKNIEEKLLILSMKTISKKYIKINNHYIFFHILYNEQQSYIFKIIDYLQKKFQSSIIILINISKKIYLKIKISKKLSKIIQANTLILKILKKISGKGGGNIYFSEGIINSSLSIKKIISKCKKLVLSKIQNKIKKL